MRNLKKILALVLALVMSLSLMATASATDFTDDSQFNPNYKTAAEVLEKLGVLKGYTDGSFDPTGSISRAEAAAAVYRIVTGDVDNKQVDIYADYNIFTDVNPGDWYAGYVNFCANAEYIKGNGDGTFDPNAKVNGYAALAMILRAIGYTANGGFTGDEWHIQAARTAESRKITKNIMTGTLGEDASRETVAEILFQAILVNMVDHNQDNTYNGSQGYFETNTTLGYQTFKLEELEGVVVGNEFADLYSEDVLPEGKTDFEVAEGDVRRLDKGTELTDIGESRIAYISGSTVLAFGDSEHNVVWENDGAAVKASKAIAEVGKAKDGETEYYWNFGHDGYYTSDVRIEYTIWKWMTESEFDNYVDIYGGKYVSRQGPYDGYYWYNYDRAIKAGDPISHEDMANIREIFTESNGVWGYDEDQTLPGDNIGQVFVRTQTKEDISDKISYKQFVAEYINDEAWEISWDESVNGQWVKIVDYNNDGVVDYAFLTGSTLDKAMGVYKNSAKDEVMGYRSLIDDPDLTGYTVRYLDEVEVGDVILYTIIDNQALVELAKVEEAKINNVNYKDVTVTAEDGTVYEQSYIVNATTMQENILRMAADENYNLYLDHFGYVRAYELTAGTKYALLTEIYATNSQDGHLIKNHPLTVEMVTADEEGNKVQDEYSTTSNVFVADDNYSLVSNKADTSRYYNWLLPATAHLGTDPAYYSNGTQIAGTGAAPADPHFNDVRGSWQFWTQNNQWVRVIDSLNALNDTNCSNPYYYSLLGSMGTTFDYGAQTTKAGASNTNTASFTNVARYTDSGDGSVNLYGAAQYAYETNGDIAIRPNGQAVYAVDYVQLATTDPGKGAAHYEINANYPGWATSNGYVNAVNDTEYFIAYNGGVYYCKGRANFPGLEKAGYIYAAYAVATNTTKDFTNNNDYWIADVIVYEVEKNPVGGKIFDSLSLVYYNTQKTYLKSVDLDLNTLNNEHTPVDIEVVPASLGWDDGQYNNVGFYELYDVKAQDDVLYAKSINKITEDFNANGIYAGVINRSVGVLERGDYIDVYKQVTYDENGDFASYDGKTFISINNPFGVTEYKVTQRDVYGNVVTNEITDATALRGYSDFSNGLGESWGAVKGNDRVIWVLNGDGEVAFVVDLDTILWTQTVDRWTPQWLVTLWNRIMNEQVMGGNFLAYTEYSATDLAKLSPATLIEYLKWLKDYEDVTTTMITNATTAATTVKNANDTTNEEAADLTTAITGLSAAASAAALNDAKVAAITALETAADGALGRINPNDAHAKEIKAQIEKALADAIAAVNAATNTSDVTTAQSNGAAAITAAETYSGDIELEVTNKNGVASTSVNPKDIDSDYADTNGLNIIVTDDGTKDLTKISVSLPAGDITEDLDQDTDVNIETDIGNVSFTVRQLDKILKDNPTADEDEITVVIDDQGNVGSDVMDQLGEDSVAVAFNVTIESNGEELDVRGVSIDLTLPVAGMGEGVSNGDTVSVYYVDENGDLVFVATGTVTDGMVSFTTTHLTVFVITDGILASEAPEAPELTVDVKPARLHDTKTDRNPSIQNSLYSTYSVTPTAVSGEENAWNVELKATGVKAHQREGGSSDGYWVGLAFVPTVTTEGWSVKSAELKAFSNMDDDSRGDSRGTNTAFGEAQYENPSNHGEKTADLIAYYINVGDGHSSEACTWKFMITVEWTLKYTGAGTAEDVTVTDTYYLELEVMTASAS